LNAFGIPIYKDCALKRQLIRLYQGLSQGVCSQASEHHPQSDDTATWVPGWLGNWLSRHHLAGCTLHCIEASTKLIRLCFAISNAESKGIG